jgi:hypothetical protein
MPVHIIDDYNSKKYYLLLSFDTDSDAKSIIDKKILPYLDDNKESLIS